MTNTSLLLPGGFFFLSFFFFETDELNDLTLIYLNVKTKNPELIIMEGVINLLSSYYMLSTFHAFYHFN